MKKILYVFAAAVLALSSCTKGADIVGGYDYYEYTLGGQYMKHIADDLMAGALENLEIAKTAILSRLRTQRIIGESVLFHYLSDRELGLEEPLDKQVFEQVGNLTMEDLRAIHEQWIKGRTYSYAILGDPADLDLRFLRTLGPVKQLTLEEIFGY